MAEVLLEHAQGMAATEPDETLELRNSLEALSLPYARRAGRTALAQIADGTEQESAETEPAPEGCVEVFDRVMRTGENIAGNFAHYFSPQYADAYRSILAGLEEQADREENERTQITVNGGSGYINGVLIGVPIPKTDPRAPFTVEMTLRDREGVLHACNVLPGAITVHKLEDAA